VNLHIMVPEERTTLLLFLTEAILNWLLDLKQKNSYEYPSGSTASERLVTHTSVLIVQCFS
jgi:hypothetical protein